MKRQKHAGSPGSLLYLWAIVETIHWTRNITQI